MSSSASVPGGSSDENGGSLGVLALAASSVEEIFEGFSAFYAKVQLENDSRPPSQPLISRDSLEELCKEMEVVSLRSLFLLSTLEPAGFMGAVTNASPPCECFSSLRPMSRRVLLGIISDHQVSLRNATLPPLGFSMVGTSGANASASGTSGATSAGAPTEVGGKNTSLFSACDLDNVLRSSLSNKTTAADAFSKLAAIWRLTNKRRIPQYQHDAFMVYSVEDMVVLWRTNLMSALMGAPLPLWWANARAFSQVNSMTVFTDKNKLDLFLRMKVSGHDIKSFSLADFYPGGKESWRITDAVSVTAGAKVFLKYCLEGFVTAMVFVFDDLFETARAWLISGLSPFSYNAMDHPDAIVFLKYHTALHRFATLITEQRGSAERPLSGPEHNVKVLIDCFAHLAADEWTTASSQDFDQFNRSVFPTIAWPGTRQDLASPGKRKPEVEHTEKGESVTTAKKPKKSSTYEDREAKRQALKQKATYSSVTSSMSGLSLGGSGASVATTASAVSSANERDVRLCAAVLCGFAGVKYHHQVVSCKKGDGCKYVHPVSVDDVLKDDALLAIGRLKNTAKDVEMINYLTAAEGFYAGRST